MSARLGDAIGLSNGYRAMWARDRHLLEEREKFLAKQSFSGFDEESLALLHLSFDLSSFVADQRLCPYLQIDLQAARDLLPVETRKALSAFGYFGDGMCELTAAKPQARTRGIGDGALCHYGARYLPNTLKRGLAYKDVIDTSGCDASSAKIFLDEYAMERVFSFEPEPASYAGLVTATKAERASGRIFALHQALSDRCGLAQLGPPEEREKRANILSPDAPSVLVETTTLDHFVAAKEDARIGLIRLDVGGDAVPVLRGAIRTIQMHRPVLIVSIDHTPSEFAATPPFLVEEFPDYAFMIRKVTPNLFSGTVCIGIPRHH